MRGTKKLLAGLTVFALTTSGGAAFSAFAAATVTNNELVVTLAVSGSPTFASGTAPFDTTKTLGDGTVVSYDAGTDANNSDRVVRTFDTFVYRADWNVNEVSTTSTFINLTLTDPVTVSDGAPNNNPVIDAVWKTPLPDSCVKATSNITNSGRTLHCDLGPQKEGTNGTIYPSGEVNGSVNGTIISVSGTIQSDAGAPVSSDPSAVSPIPASTPNDFVVSAAPKWDWVKLGGLGVSNNLAPPYEYPDVVDQNGVAGRIYVQPLGLGSSDPTGKGSEPLASPTSVTFTDDYSAYPAGSRLLDFVPAGYEWMTEAGLGCAPLRRTVGNWPFGDSTNVLATPQNTTAAPGQWTCVDDPATRKMVVTAANFNTNIIPTLGGNGTSNDSKIAAAAQISIFVPYTALQGAATNPTNGRGDLRNVIDGDPNTAGLQEITNGMIGVSGAQNVGETTTNNDSYYEYFLVLGSYYDSVNYYNNGQIKISNQEKGQVSYPLPNMSGSSTSYQAHGTVSPGENITNVVGTFSRATQPTPAFYATCQMIDTTNQLVSDLPTLTSTGIVEDQVIPANPGPIANLIWIKDTTITDGIGGVPFTPVLGVDYTLEFSSVPTASLSTGATVTDPECDNNDTPGGASDWVSAGNTAGVNALKGPIVNGVQTYTITRIRFKTLTKMRAVQLYTQIGIVIKTGTPLGLARDDGAVAGTQTLDPNTHTWLTHISSTAPVPANPNAPIDFATDNTALWNNITFDGNFPLVGEVTPPTYWGSGPGPSSNKTDKLNILLVSPKVIKTLVSPIKTTPYLRGETLTWKVVASLPGIVGDTASDVVVADNLPVGLDALSATLSAGCGTPLTSPTFPIVGSGTANEVSWSFGDKASSWNCVITVKTRITGGVDYSNLTNIANVTTTDRGSAGSSAFVTLGGSFDGFAILKQTATGLGDCTRYPDATTTKPSDWASRCERVSPNSIVNFTLTMENKGSAVLPNVSVIDVLPHLGDGTEAQTSFAGIPAGPTGTLGDGRTPGSAFTGTVALNAAPSATRENGASVVPTLWYSMATPTTINRDPDAPSNLTGGTTTWCVALTGTLANGVTGPCPTTLAQVTAVQLKFASIALGDVISATVPVSFANNKTAVASSPPQCSYYTNTFGARTSSVKVPVRSNDVSVMLDCVDVSLSKKVVTPLAASLDSDVGYQVTVTNAGPDSATGVEIVDSLPAGYGYVSHTGGSTQPSSAPPTWNIASLAPGASVTLSLTTHIPKNVTDVTNTVQVTKLNEADIDSTPDNFYQTPSEDDEASAAVAVLGDYAWFDLDRDGIQGETELPAPGVTASLLNAAGTVMATAVTDSNGFYRFVISLAGDYHVAFSTIPDKHVFTSKNQGVDTLIDSDADPVTGMTAAYPVAMGDIIVGADTGIYPTIDLSLTKKLITPGPFSLGSIVNYQLTVHNNGPANAIPGWQVTDVLPSGLELIDMKGVAPTSSLSCANNVCTSNVALISGDDAEEILVRAKIVSGAGGGLRNVAYIAPNPQDAVENNPLGQIPDSTTNTSATATNNDGYAVIFVDATPGTVSPTSPQAIALAVTGWFGENWLNLAALAILIGLALVMIVRTRITRSS